MTNQLNFKRKGLVLKYLFSLIVIAFFAGVSGIAQSGHEGHDHPHPHPAEQSVPPGLTDASNPLEADVYFRPWREAADEYAKLIKDGPKLETYIALGDIYMNEGFHHHAKFYYDLALAQDGNSEDAQAKVKKAAERIAYLEERFTMFQNKAMEDKDITGFGSMAAIRFHLGFHQEGMSILKNAVDTYGMDQRVYPLLNTFNQQLETQIGALGVLHKEFKASLVNDEKEKAVSLFGQVAFGSLGHPDSFVMLKEIRNVFPDLVNEETFQLYNEFVNQFTKS